MLAHIDRVIDNQWPFSSTKHTLAEQGIFFYYFTDEIIDAWGKAYGYIADAFIDIEKKLYAEAEHQEGGGRLPEWGYVMFILFLM